MGIYEASPINPRLRATTAEMPRDGTGRRQTVAVYLD
jgi:hypothetical protein